MNNIDIFCKSEFICWHIIRLELTYVEKVEIYKVLFSPIVDWDGQLVSARKCFKCQSVQININNINLFFLSASFFVTA